MKALLSYYFSIVFIQYELIFIYLKSNYYVN